MPCIDLDTKLVMDHSWDDNPVLLALSVPFLRKVREYWSLLKRYLRRAQNLGDEKNKGRQWSSHHEPAGQRNQSFGASAWQQVYWRSQVREAVPCLLFAL